MGEVQAGSVKTTEFGGDGSRPGDRQIGVAVASSSPFKTLVGLAVAAPLRSEAPKVNTRRQARNSNEGVLSSKRAWAAIYRSTYVASSPSRRMGNKGGCGDEGDPITTAAFHS